MHMKSNEVFKLGPSMKLPQDRVYAIRARFRDFTHADGFTVDVIVVVEVEVGVEAVLVLWK